MQPTVHVLVVASSTWLVAPTPKEANLLIYARLNMVASGCGSKTTEGDKGIGHPCPDFLNGVDFPLFFFFFYQSNHC